MLSDKKARRFSYAFMQEFEACSDRLKQDQETAQRTASLHRHLTFFLKILWAVLLSTESKYKKYLL